LAFAHLITRRLATYEFQLSQVAEALAADPGNGELQNLHAELENLISLSRELAAGPSSSPKRAATSSASAAAAPAAPAAAKVQSPHAAEGVKKEARRYAAGEEVLAKYNVSAAGWCGDAAGPGD
jgi:survival-of-motor-neuron-related-splicing factor 30